MNGVTAEAGEQTRSAPPATGPPHTQIHGYLRRALENAQDVIVIGLMLLLLAVALRAMWRLFELAFLLDTPYQVVLSHMVFIFIPIELYRTLIFYLREHRIAVGLIVEATIVSLLSSLILSVPHSDSSTVFSTSLLLVVLSAMLALDRWLARLRNDVPDTSAH